MYIINVWLIYCICVMCINTNKKFKKKHKPKCKCVYFITLIPPPIRKVYCNYYGNRLGNSFFFRFATVTWYATCSHNINAQNPSVSSSSYIIHSYTHGLQTLVDLSCIEKLMDPFLLRGQLLLPRDFPRVCNIHTFRNYYNRFPVGTRNEWIYFVKRKNK